MFVCFVALRPKSTAKVMVGRSVHLTTLFPGQAWTSGKPEFHEHTFTRNWQQPFLNDSTEGRRMTIVIISLSISKKVWDRARIKLRTPGSAVRLASVARHVTYCARQPGRVVQCSLGQDESIAECSVILVTCIKWLSVVETLFWVFLWVIA